MPDSTRRRVSRRRFVRAASATGVIGGVAGCLGGDGDDGATDNESDQEAPEDATEIQWYGGFGDGEGEEVKEEVREALWDAGLSEDIFVRILNSPETSDEMLDQLRTWLGAGRETPDMMNMDSGWSQPFIQREQIPNMSEEYFSDDMESTIQEEYFQASVESISDRDGNLFGIPLFPDFPTMNYRKDLVEEAGYDPEGNNWATEPMTWERFSEVVADTFEQADVEYGYTFQADNYEGLSCCNFNEFMSSWGGAFFGGRDNLFGPVGDRPVTVDEEPVIDSIRMVRAFIHGEDDDEALDGYQQIAPEAVLGWAEETSRAPFTDGNAIAHRNWPYSLNINGAEDAHGEDLGAMPLPYAVEEGEGEYPEIGGTTAALGGWNAVMNPNTNNPDAVVEVMQAVMDPDFQLFQFEHPNIGLLPPRAELLDSEEAEQLEVIGRYVDTLRVAGENAMPRPVTIAWPDQTGAIADAVNGTYRQQQPPDQAMSDLAERLEAMEEDAAQDQG